MPAQEAAIRPEAGRRCEACGRAAAAGEFVRVSGRGASLKLLCAECLAGHVLFAKRREGASVSVTVVFREGVE